MVQGFFWVMSEDLGIFWGPEFCLHSIIPVIHKSEYPPWGFKPRGLRISSDGDDRRMLLGFKFSITGFFWVGKFGKFFFGMA